MGHQIIHPSKEQVRAYMAEREAARRPPPTPEEIRRQLGWRMVSDEDDKQMLLRLYLIPSTLGHLATQIAFDWLLAGVRESACRSAEH
ncbi:MAG: hypothetical protein V4857_24150 [Pseudomonadota bacterium]